MDRPLRVLLVGEPGLFRAGLSALLESDAVIRAVGAVEPTPETALLARRLAPEVLVLDLSSVGKEPIEFVRNVARAVPATRVLVLTHESDGTTLLPVLASGAHGLVPKSSAADYLNHAIRALAHDGVFLPPAATRLLCEWLRSRKSSRARSWAQ